MKENNWIKIENGTKIPENETCWFYNEYHDFVFLGVFLYLPNEGWIFAKSNGIIYIENGTIVTEAEIDDLIIPTHYSLVPKLPIK